MRKRMLIGLGLVVAQQLTGQANVLTYASDIFKSVGFCGDLLSALATVVVGCVKVCATLVSLLTVDRLGRRLLLLSGSAVMMASLLCLLALSLHPHHQLEQPCSNTQLKPSNYSTTIQANFSHNTEDCPTDETSISRRPLALVGVLLFVAAYSLSFGPVTWILLTELFPAPLKSRAMSLGQASNWAANVLVSVTFLDLVSALGLPAVLSSYALCTGLAIVFVFKLVPETKDKSLAQVQEQLARKQALQSKELNLIGNIKQEKFQFNSFSTLEEENTEDC